MTLREFISQYDYETNKFQTFYVFMNNVICSGTSVEPPQVLTLRDLTDCIVDSDCQFGYDENNNLVDSLFDHIVDDSRFTTGTSKKNILSVYVK
jgi:hypothetical protein